MAELLPADDFSTSATEQSFTVPTTPLTDQQIAEAQRRTELQTNRPLQATPDLNAPGPVIDATQEFVKRNQQGDVPLQINGPGQTQMTFGPLYRFQVGRRRLMSDKETYLKGQFGDANVRTSEDGHDFIVRVNDPETGKPKDVLFNEKQITLGDLAALAGTAPEAAAGLLATKAGRGIPTIGGYKGALGFLRDVVLGSAGAEAGGAINDVEARAETGQPIQPGEIAKSRAANVPLDVSMGYLGAGVLKAGAGTLSAAKGPLNWAKTESQQLAQTAVNNIEQKTGIRLLQTPGEASGWPVLIQGEQYLRAHPASAAKMAVQDREVAAKTAELSKYMTSGAGTDEEAGNALKSALQAQRDVIEGNVTSAAGQVENAATGQIDKSIASTGATPQPSPIQTGGKVRAGVLAKRDSILNQSRSNYEKVYELPEAKEPIIPTGPLQKTLDSIKENLPDKAKQIESIFYDQYGNPMTKTSEGRELLPGWTQDELKRFLSGGFDPKMPLNKMVEMRDLLYDRIAQGDAVQGIPTRYLKQIGNSITQAIDEGTAGSPELAARLKTANEYYKKNVLKIQEPGIADLVPKINEPGFVEDSRAIKSLWTDPDRYKRTIEFVGKDSETAKTINRSIADSIIRDSATDGTMQTIDGNALFSKLMDFKKSNPDTFNAVFGKSIGNLAQSAKALAAASEQGEVKIAMDDALSFFEPGNKSPTLKALHDLAQAQRTRDAELKNTILRNYSSPNFDPSTVRPDDFVSSFLDSGTSSEVKTVINRIRDLDPEIAQQIGRKTVEKVLSKANGSGKALEAILSDPKNAEKLPDVVGPGSWEMLESFKDYLKNQDRYKEVAGGTGVLTKGSAIGRLFKTPGLQELSDLVKKKIAAYVISSPSLRAIASAPYSPTELPDLGKAVVTSVPFLKAAAEDFGNDVPGLTTFIQASKSAAGLIAPNQNSARPTDTRLPADQF